MEPLPVSSSGSRPCGCSDTACFCRCPSCVPLFPAASLARPRQLRSGLRLEFLTVGWNLVEGIVSVMAAVAAGSVALLGFGIDSFVESASGSILIWRLAAERRGGRNDVEQLDRRARRAVAVSLAALAVFVSVDAVRSLLAREVPEPSALGIVVTAVSLVVMSWLARAKRRTAAALESRALEADAFQTTACWWLSLSALTGLGLNAALGWWWADPLAALVMTVFLLREARESWRGEPCCDVC